MIKYEHTQIGYLILAVSLAVLLFYGWLYRVIFLEMGFDLVALAVMAIILFLLVSFSTLRVKIDENYLRIKFGYGIFRKKFLLQEIVSVKSVTNHWYYGWGIKVWFWPYMWIYNVSGFEAVEITMRNGKIFRIGTDTPGELEAAIRTVIR